MKRLLALTLMLSSTAVAAQPAATPAITQLGRDGTILNISAEGQSRRTPDVAIFNAGVVSQGKTASEAMTDNSRKMDTVVAQLRRAGIAQGDIQTSSISLQPRYYHPEREAMMRARTTGQPYIPQEPEAPRIVGYEARNSVQVRLRRLGEMGRIIDTLIQSGANQVDGPSFMLDEQQAAMDEARRQALSTARERAELYARATGMRVGRIISISEAGGHYPQHIMVTGSRGESMGGPPPPPVAAGEVALGINLSVQFELTR